MPTVRERFLRALRATIDAITYSLVLTVVAVLVAFTLSLTTGGGAVRANVLLFVMGWALMAYATVRLWPTSPASEDKPSEKQDASLPGEDVSRFQALARTLPPVRWIRLPPPEHRIPLRNQLFLASLFILLTSFLLENCFDVA